MAVVALEDIVDNNLLVTLYVANRRFLHMPLKRRASLTHRRRMVLVLEVVLGLKLVSTFEAILNESAIPRYIVVSLMNEPNLETMSQC